MAKNKPSPKPKIPKSFLNPNLWEDNKGKVQKIIEKHILNNIEAGREPRAGLSTLKIGKATFEIKDVNQWLKKIKNNPNSKARIPVVDSAYRLMKNLREDQLKIMTGEGGAKTKYGAGARNLLKGQQDHHLRFRALFEPFYKNLDKKQAKELTKWFEQQGSPLGNVLENLEGIDQDLHQTLDDSIHTWAKDNQIQVDAFTKDQWESGGRNIKGGLARGGASGEIIDTGKKIKGIQGPKIPENIPVRKVSQAKMPYLGDLPFNERLVAASDYLNYVEEPLLKKSSEIMEKQDLRRLKENPNYKAKTKEQWFNKWKTEGKAVAQSSMAIEDLVERNPNLKESDINEILENVRNPKKKLSPELTKRLGIKPKGFNLSKFGKTLAIGTGVAAGTSLIGGPQGHAAGMYAKTGEGKYLKDLSIAAGRDLTVGYGLTTGLSIAGKAAAKGALTKGLVRSAALRTLGGAVAGPLGIPLMIYGAYDTANQFTKAYTGRSINERIKNKAVSLYKNTLKNPELLISDSRADLKKHGILTNYQGGNDAMDATIDAIKKDPEMKESWGLKSHLFMDRA